MSLDDQLQNDLKTAMRTKDTLRLSAIRMLRAAFQAEANAKRQRTLEAFVKAQGRPLDAIDPAQLPAVEPLTDAEMLQLIGREIKRRQDSVDMYTTAGRVELAEQEAAEIGVLRGYLPAQLSVDDLRPMVQAIIAEVGATSKADTRKVMPVVMQRLRDKADGRTLNQMVAELLSK